MEPLLKYIRSTFNYTHDIDTKNDAVNPKLQLLNKDVYNIFVTDICIPGYESLTEEYTHLVQKAADEWSGAINNKIRFKLVHSLEGADIKIFWIRSTRIYLARQNTDNNTIAEKLVLNIGIMDMFENVYSTEMVYHLLLHELGHILTLGHSPIEGDVMACASSYPCHLSKNDIFVLNLIYNLGSGVSYFEKEEEIKKQVEKFLKLSNKLKTKVRTQQTEKRSLQKQTSKDLLGSLEAIEEVLKYNLTLQNIELNTETKKKFQQLKYLPAKQESIIDNQ